MNKYGKLALILFQSAIVSAALAFFFNLMGNMLLRHTWTPLVTSTSLVADSSQTFEVNTEFKTTYHIRICPWNRVAFPVMSIRWWVVLQQDTIGTGNWDGNVDGMTSGDTCLAVGEFKSWANDKYSLVLLPSLKDSLSAKPPTVGLSVGVAPQFQQNYELRAKQNHTLTKLVAGLAALLAFGAAALFLIAIIKR